MSLKDVEESIRDAAKDVEKSIMVAAGMTPEPEDPNEFIPIRTVPRLAKVGLVLATVAATAALLVMTLVE